MQDFDRRLLLQIMTAGTAVGVSSIARAQHAPSSAPRVEPDQVPAREGIAQLPDTKIYYWDTGGNGEAVFLLHPGTGSPLVWGFQQPVFAKAGYRVIAHSRRGFYKSGPPFAGGARGDDAEDLKNLADHLGIDKFHVMGSGGGGIIALSMAIKHPSRLLSATLACTVFGMSEPSFLDKMKNLNPPLFREFHEDFRELSGAYRITNPAGTARWLALESAPDRRVRAPAGSPAPDQRRPDHTYANLQKIKTPMLLVAGDADLLIPPPIVREVASHIPGSEVFVVPDSGHSSHWEQPEVFNRKVLDFIRKHKRA